MTTIDRDEVQKEMAELRGRLQRALDELNTASDAEVDFIVKIANGEVETPPNNRESFLEMIDSVLRSLRMPLVGTMGNVLPEGFWLSELGQAIMRARVVLTDDELITRAEAARRIFGAAGKRERMTVKRMADAGRLTSYRVLSAKPSRSGLLSAREVQALIDADEK